MNTNQKKWKDTEKRTHSVGVEALAKIRKALGLPKRKMKEGDA